MQIKSHNHPKLLSEAKWPRIKPYIFSDVKSTMTLGSFTNSQNWSQTLPVSCTILDASSTPAVLSTGKGETAMNYNAKDCPAWISSLFRTQLISFFWCFTVPMLYCQFSLLCYRSTWYSISEARLCNVSYQSCYFLPCLVTTLHFSSDEVALLLPEVLFWCQGQPGNPWFVFRATQARNASCMRSKKYKTPQYIIILRCFGTSLGSNSAGLLTRHKAKTQKNMEYWKALHPSTPERSRAFNKPSTTLDPNFQP